MRSSAMGFICNFVFVKIMMLLQYEVSFISEETVPSYFPPGNDNNSFSSLSKLKTSCGNNILFFLPVYDPSLSLHLTHRILNNLNNLNKFTFERGCKTVKAALEAWP